MCLYTVGNHYLDGKHYVSWVYPSYAFIYGTFVNWTDCRTSIDLTSVKNKDFSTINDLISVNNIFKNFNETLDLNVTTQTAMDYSKNVSIRKITLCYQVHKRDLPKKGNFLNAARTKYFQANTRFWGHFTPHNKWRIRLSLEFHLIKVIQATNVSNFLVS